MYQKRPQSTNGYNAAKVNLCFFESTQLKVALIDPKGRQMQFTYHVIRDNGVRAECARLLQQLISVAYRSHRGLLNHVS